MNTVGPEGMWDEEDGFFYDVLRRPDGSATRLKVRSMVGLLPLAATTLVEPSDREKVPGLMMLFEERTPPHAGAGGELLSGAALRGPRAHVVGGPRASAPHPFPDAG